MLNGKKIAVVVPAYNEEKQILMVLESMPDFVDRIIVVDDCSKDKTIEVAKQYKRDEYFTNKILIEKKSKILEENIYNYADIVLAEMEKLEEENYIPSIELAREGDYDRIIILSHQKNGGVGAAIATGYKWARDHEIDCTAVMAGDGQMDPAELESICLPVVRGEVDYVKGNRLVHKAAKKIIPKVRFIGNTILSVLTKFASGYWHISDTQTGYTAISLSALRKIDIYKIYHSYGMPNDLLVKLNIENCTICEIPIKPVYAVGEKSKMKILKVIPRISLLLIKLFFKRLTEKYVKKDLHPLSLFYFGSMLSGIMDLIFFGYIVYHVLILNGSVSIGFYITLLILTVTSVQLFLFAMWIDIQENERLYKS